MYLIINKIKSRHTMRLMYVILKWSNDRVAQT